MKETLGIVVELVGDIFVVAGYTGQRLATLDPSADGTERGEPSRFCSIITKYICNNPKWVAGFLVFALGQALELVALGLASESTVVAIGNLSLVFNAIASVYVFGEDFSVYPPYRGFRLFQQWDGFNLLLLIVGSALTVAYAPTPSEEEETGFNADELRRMWYDSPFVYFNVVMVMSMTTLGFFCYRNLHNEQEQKAPMLLASTLAILAAFSVTLTKVVSELLSKSFSGDNQFLDIGAMFMTITWVIGLVSQLVLLNIGLRNFEQTVFIPMFETMSSSITIVFGVMYFKTYEDFKSTKSIFGFWIGVVTLIIGLFLASRRHSPSREEMVAKLNERSPRSAAHKTLSATSNTSLLASSSVDDESH